MKKAKEKKSLKANHTKSWKTYAGGLLALFAFLLYSNTFSHDFAQDDAIVITDNMFTTQGLSGWEGILSYDTFYGFFKEEGKAQLVSGGRYRPFSLLIFALEYEIFEDEPRYYHILNALYYALLVFLIFVWLRRLLRDQVLSFWIAFFTTLLFAAHPIHTEVVANIKGRDEIYALLFSISTVLYLVKSYDLGRKGITMHLMAGMLFMFGLLSKENTITFLAIIPLMFIWFRSQNIQRAFTYTLGPLASTFLFLIWRHGIIDSTFSGDLPMELMNNPYLKWTGSGYELLSWVERLPMVLLTLGKYLLLFIFPHPLTHDYYPKMIDYVTFRDIGVIITTVIYGLMIWLFLRGSRRHSTLSFAIAFYLITLSIVSNLVVVVGTNMSERFLFMPSLGLCLFVTDLVMSCYTDKRTWPTLLLAVMSLAFAVKTWTRNPVWKNNYTLFTTDISVSDRSAKLQNSVGGVLLENIDDLDGEAKKNQVRKAISHLKKAVELHPTFKSSRLLLGNAHYHLESYEEAVEHYQEALALDSEFADAKMNLAMSYRAQKTYDKAIQLLESVMLRKNYELEAKNKLALILEEAGLDIIQKGRPQDAIAYFEKGLEIGVDNAKFNYFLGIAHGQIGDLAKGIRYLESALNYDAEEDNKKNIQAALQTMRMNQNKKKKAN